MSVAHLADRMLERAGRWGVVAIAALAIMTACSAGPASAQGKPAPLTEARVQAFVAAQKDIAAILDKLDEAASAKPDAKVQAQLEAIAKKNGFASFADFDGVASQVSLVMSGIDPQTKAFTEPKLALEKEIAAVTADKSLSKTDKDNALKELRDAVKAAQPVDNPSDIALVTKYYDQIDAVLNRPGD